MATIQVGGMEVDLNSPICKYENIYKGKILKSGKNISVKRVSKKDFLDYQKRVEREKKVSNKILQDTKMARIEDLDIECDEDFYYIGYQEIKTTLMTVIENMNKEKFNLKEILLDALKGLNSLHKRIKQPHRNIRPQNIFITDNENGFSGLISNYALSKEYEPGHYLQSISDVPTRGYVAPEYFNNFEGDSSKNPKKKRKVTDDSVDIFSLGVVMFEAFSLGQHPYIKNAGDDPQDNINKNKKVNFQKDILKVEPWENPLAMKLMKWMLEKNPTRRPKASQIIDYCPLFWNMEKIENFFVAVHGYFTTNLKQTSVIYNTKYKTWFDSIDQVVVDAIKNKHVNQNLKEGTYYLLASIRNLVSHSHEDTSYSKNLREFLKNNGFDGVIPYIQKIFPELLTFLYEKLQSYTNVETIKIYYCDFNFNA